MDILDKIYADLKNSIEDNEGISLFVRERAKFEGWLKVKVVELLINNGIKEIIPEKDRVDITFNKEKVKYAIELKTVNTNYENDTTKNKTKPITNNIESILKDIKKLNKLNYDKRVILFIVFPIEEKDMKNWSKHISKIKKRTNFLNEKTLNFKNNRKGLIYCGVLK